MSFLNLLNRIHTPSDVKELSPTDLPILCEEIREALISNMKAVGGHLGPNLGFLEVTVALHYVFDSPRDKIVYDVSHQSYTHKILTGRKDGFVDPAHYGKYSGYTNPNESEHDMFTIGHTSTSVSLATGLAKGRDLLGGTENIIAVIGDGALSGGEAMEGLNIGSTLDSNLIVVFNDNDMSISPNVGSMYKHFKALRDHKGQLEHNYFTIMGFDYYFVEDGHNIDELIKAFKAVKDVPRPSLIHVVTTKGKGWAEAEADKESFHYINTAHKPKKGTTLTYAGVVADHLLEKMKTDPAVIAMTAAIPGTSGFNPERRAKAGKQFFDVGIAEEHMIAMAAGLAKNGAKPVVLENSTFLSRTYDQLSQDLCLNSNPATIMSYGLSGGIGATDATHTGAFDLAMMGSIPNLIVLCPASKDEVLAMLDWSLEQREHPVVIRVTGAVRNEPSGTAFTGKLINEVTHKGQKVAILGLGPFYYLGNQLREALKAELGIEATLINPRLASDVDTHTLDALKADHEIIITLEDGVLAGGYGQKVVHYYGPTSMKVLTYGMEKEVNDRVPKDELYARYGLEPKTIVEDIKTLLR